MKEEAKLGRLVQCKCSHTCATEDIGYQWILPRTKSKHMLFEGILVKDQQDQDNMMKTLEEAFGSISLEKVSHKKIKKRLNSRPISIVNLNLKKRVIKEEKNNKLLVLKEFTVICSTATVPTLEQFANEYY